jgi:hypothetical protein
VDAKYQQIRRHIEKLWRRLTEVEACAADHGTRLDVVERAIMERSARHEEETRHLSQMNATLGARLEVGGRVIAGDIQAPET